MSEKITASGNAASAAVSAEQSTPLELWQEKNYFELHSEILVYGRATCENLLQMAKGLKRMNDEKLFKAGGYSTFEEYTETALGIKNQPFGGFDGNGTGRTHAYDRHRIDDCQRIKGKDRRIARGSGGKRE